VNNYPPVLNIPASPSFRDLHEVEVELLFPTGKEFVSKKYGTTQYRWSVNVEGVEHSLFASEALNNKIMEHRPEKGTCLSIAKVGTGKDTRWDVVYKSGPQGSGSPAPARSTGSTAAPARAAHNPDAYAKDRDMYIRSLRDAETIAIEQGLSYSVDLNAIAFVLFKMAKDYGITDLDNPHAGSTDQPNTTQAAESQGKDKMREELEKMFKETHVHGTQVLNILRAFAPDGATVNGWSDVTRDMGLAIYAAAQSVKAGSDTWASYLTTEDEFPPDSELPF